MGSGFLESEWALLWVPRGTAPRRDGTVDIPGILEDVWSPRWVSLSQLSPARRRIVLLSVPHIVPNFDIFRSTKVVHNIWDT